MSDVAALGLSVASGEVKTATADLNALSKAAQTAEQASDKLKTAAAGAGAASGQAGVAHKAAAGATQQAADALGKATAAHMAHGAAAKFNSVQMQEALHVGRSMLEMFAQGVSPLRALTMEGARISTFFSMGQGGVAGTFATVAGMARTAATGIVGLGAASAAAAAIGIASAISWQNAQDRLARSLEGTGRLSGMNQASLNAAAARGALAGNLSLGQARDLAGGFAQAGLNADATASLVGSTRRFANFTGQSIPDAGAALAKAAGDPTKGVALLDSTFGMLNASVVESIRHLDAMGDRQGAQATFIQAYNTALAATTDQTWSLSRAFESAKAGLGNLVDKIGSSIAHVATGPTLDERRASLEATIKEIQNAQAKGQASHTGFAAQIAGAFGGPADNPALKQAQDQLAKVNAEIAKKAADDAAKAAQAELDRKSRLAQSAVDELLPDDTERKKLQERAALLDATSSTSPGNADAAARAKAQLDVFRTATEGVRASTELAVQSTLTRSDVELAALQAEDRRKEVLRQTGDATRAAAEAEGVLARQRADAQRAIQDLARSVGDEASLAGLRPAQRQMRELEIRQRDFREPLSPSVPLAGNSPMSILQGQVGRNASDVQPFLSAGGQGLIAKFAAWCAAALNSALEQAGIHGSGSNMARSLLKVGTPVETPQRGDVVVLSRGGANSGLGHTGFYDSTNPDGTIRVLGGNTGGKVGYANFSPSKVLGYRRVGAGPEASGDLDALQRQQRQLLQSDITTGLNSPIGVANDNLNDQIALLNKETSAWGGTTASMAAAAEAQKLINDYTRAGIDINPDLQKQIDQTAKGYGDLAVAQERANDALKAMDDVRSGLRDGVGTFASDLLHGASAATALHDALSRLADRALNSALDGLFNSILGKSGSSGGILGSLFGGIFGGGGSIPGAVSAVGASSSIGVFASGTDYAPGGLSLVGEKGPELVNLPRGSSVITNDNLRNGNWGSSVNDNSRTYHIDARGAQAGVADQIVAGLKAYDAELDRTIGVKVSNWRQNN